MSEKKKKKEFDFHADAAAILQSVHGIGFLLFVF